MCPHTAVHQLTCNFHVARTVEDFGCKSDHPTSEAGDVFAVWGEDLVCGRRDSKYTGEENCAVCRGKGAEEEFFGGDRDESFVHFAILRGSATKEEIFLKERR